MMLLVELLQKPRKNIITMNYVLDMYSIWKHIIQAITAAVDTKMTAINDLTPFTRSVRGPMTTHPIRAPKSMQD